MEVKLKCETYDGTVNIKKWSRGDPVPLFSPWIGVDTETTLIKDTVATPDLVVMGVYNAEDNTAYITDWKEAPFFLQEILKRDVKIYLANAGFDYYVLHCKELQDAVGHDKVVDILIRAALNEIGTIGFIRTYSLKDCCKNYLKYTLNKHEEDGEESVRLNFTRDREVTEEEMQYLALDCITTYLCGEAIGPKATEYTHTRGQICLYHITSNGLPVDNFMFTYCEVMLKAEKERYRQQLLSFGFPDPMKKDLETDSERLKRTWHDFVYQWVHANVNEKYILPKDVPGKTTVKKLITWIVFNMCSGHEKSTLSRQFVAALTDDKKGMCADEKRLFNQICSDYEFLCACDTSKKAVAWPMLLECLMQNEQAGLDLDGCMEKMEELMSEHQEWFGVEEVKPTVFLQQKLHELENDYPGLHFDRTEKTGNLKCSKTSQWKLDDAGCKDPFLDAYNNYKHAEKYLTTFCNRKFIASDNRVHARFGIVNTGRSSCSKPNIQQYPSHDHTYALKNIYKPPEGAVFVSTDYSFAELVSLAECCITKYGYSVLGTIINANVDPHYYFSSRILGLIDAKLDFCESPEAAAEMMKFFKANITKEQRQLAKAVNFGCPGGMAGKRLYRHLRESGIKVTLEEAVKLRDAWVNTFTEMKEHFKRTPISFDQYSRYGMKRDDEEVEYEYEDDPLAAKKKGRELYDVTTIVGFHRNRATFNASANTDFQNPVAHLAKEALWNLEAAGLGNRMLNFVHDI